MSRLDKSNRITLRLPSNILQVLKKESEKRDLPLNAIINRILSKNIIPKELIQVVNKLFSYKRKKLQNIAKQFGKVIESDKRLEDLSGDEIISIAKQILK